MASIGPAVFKQYFDDNGLPLASGYITFKAAGTAVDKDTFTTQAGDVANANPLVLDSSGRCKFHFEEGVYDLKIYNSTGTLIAQEDNIPGSTGTGTNSVQAVTSWASLKSLSSGSSSYVDVGGYYADGDGGGGRFYWSAASSASEINGMIATPDSSPSNGRWIRIFSGPVNVLWTGAKADAATDDVAAIQVAINWFSSGKGTVYFPKGRYRCESTINIDVDRTHLYGDGMWATEFLFNPSTDDILFHFNPSAVAVLDQCSMKYLSINSSDTANVKTAIKLTDVSWFELESVAIGPIGSWTDSTNSSIGLHTNGRDQGSIRYFNCAADYPLQISNNPNGALDIDGWSFHDLILFPATTRPAILIDSGVQLTNVSFTGRQNWVGGTNGLEWIDTTSVAISSNLLIENLRTEGADDATAYSIRIEHNSNLHNLTLINCQLDSGRRGLYLRKQIGVTLIGVIYSSTSSEAINIDGTVERVRGSACFWQTGSTGTLTNQRTVWSIPMNPSNSYGLATDFILESTTLIPIPALLLSDLGMTLEGILTVPNTGLHIKDTDDSHDLIVAPGSNLTADRTLTITTGDADRTLTLSNNLTVEAPSILNQDLTTDATGVRFNSLGININGAGDGTFHVNQASAGTVAASVNGNIGIFEDSSANGISIITPDASAGVVFFTSPATTGSRGAELAFTYDSGVMNLLTRKVGSSIILSPDNAIVNLTLSGGSGSQLTTFAGKIEMGGGGPTISVGSATPEGAVTAVVGSLFLRTDGGAGTSIYVKESGAGNTGWVAK